MQIQKVSKRKGTHEVHTFDSGRLAVATAAPKSFGEPKNKIWGRRRRKFGAAHIGLFWSAVCVIWGRNICLQYGDYLHMRTIESHIKIPSKNGSKRQEWAQFIHSTHPYSIKNGFTRDKFK